MAAFRLSKWYLDCVTDVGDVSILYTGDVSWGPVTLAYSSLLTSSCSRVTTASSIVSRPSLAMSEGELRWTGEDVDGVWTPDAPGVSQTVFANEEGSIEWTCIAPRARARVNDRQGLGYAEHLVMTIAPWRLPLRTLRWGRFVSNTEALVWIDWVAEVRHTTIVRNGAIVPAVVLDDRRIELADGTRLDMDCAFVLRDGKIGATVLSAIPGVTRMFPGGLLEVAECKWRSRALLTRPDAGPVDAWVIHERVDWPH